MYNFSTDLPHTNLLRYKINFKNLKKMKEKNKVEKFLKIIYKTGTRFET